MATRTAKLYQGEDLAPVLDYTDQVIWEESEFGTRAWQGEGNASTVVIRDPLGEQGNEASLPSGLTAKSLASKNLFIIQLGTDFMFRGRVGIKNYSRDSQHVERYRQVECSLHDTNWDLDHIFVHDYVRPAETDIARAQGVIASYLSGYPRESTILNGSNFLSGSNTVNLPANTYTQTSPLGILREVAVTANKQFFVIGDTITGGSLFWDGNDSTAYPAGVRVSDRIDEINTTGVCSTSTATFVNSIAGQVSGTQNFVIPAGLNNSAVFAAVALGPFDTDLPSVVRWRIGATDYPFTYINSSVVGGVGVAFYQLLNPVAGTGTFSAITPDKWIGVWLCENVNQATPVNTHAFASGTSTVATVTVSAGGALFLDATHFYHEDLDLDFGITLTDTGPQTQDWNDTFQWGTPGYSDQLWGGGHGSSASNWTGDQSRPWVAGVLAINGDSDEQPLTFPPIWNAGPASTEDGSEQLCEVKLFYGSGTNSYVTTHDLVVHNLYGHSSETITDDTIATEAEAQTKANSILAHRKYEDKTYNVTIGPLTDEQVLCVKHGQTIQIKARAIPDADDAFRTMRIVQCRYTTPIVGIWFAHLQLGRPWKMKPYSKGPPLTPNAAGSGDTPETLGLDGDAGTDTGTFANSDHTHGHGTFGTNDLHTEYVREPILTTAGDMPYASGASVWTRLALGASNYHMVSDGAVPLWRPQSAGSGSPLTVQDEGTPLATDATTLNFVGAGVVASGTGATKTITVSGGGGGGVTSPWWWHSDNAPGSPDAANDEFDDGTIPTATRVQGVGDRGDYTESYDGLVWTAKATGSNPELDVFCVARTISIGDYVTVAGNWPLAWGNILGLFVGMSAGTTAGGGGSIVVGMGSYNPGTGGAATCMNTWTGFNTRTADGAQESLVNQSQHHIYGFRFKYEAANTWGYYFQYHSGGPWRRVTNSYSATMTPTHIVFGVTMMQGGTYTANAGQSVRLECVRVND